jgi:hypothetical protein
MNSSRNQRANKRGAGMERAHANYKRNERMARRAAIVDDTMMTEAAPAAAAAAEEEAHRDMIALFAAEDAAVRAQLAAQGRAVLRLGDHNARGMREGSVMLLGPGNRVLGCVGTAANARIPYSNAVARHRDLTERD